MRGEGRSEKKREENWEPKMCAEEEEEEGRGKRKRGEKEKKREKQWDGEQNSLLICDSKDLRSGTYDTEFYCNY